MQQTASPSAQLWLTHAHALADIAASITLRYFYQPPTASLKADNSPVTQADTQAEQAMRTYLAQHLPDHAISGEEMGASSAKAGDKEGDSAYRWVIDPIDGTRAYMAGFASYTTLIALLYNNAPIIGLIDQPVLKERYIGMQGEASTCNGIRITTTPTTAPTILQNALFSTTSPYLFDVQTRPAYEALRASTAVQQYGGDGYAYAKLASGRVHLIAESGLKAHDIMAHIPVIEGAGGVITDWHGNPLTYHAGSCNVLASANAALHQQALEVLHSNLHHLPSC